MFGRCQSQDMAMVYQVQTGSVWNTQDGAFGIISFGPLTPFWSAFVDPFTNKVASSIALARPQTNAVTTTNFTMGSVDLSYQGQSNASLATQYSFLFEQYGYYWDQLNFGILYSTDGEFTSEFTETISVTDFKESKPIAWSTTFNGLGL